MAVLTKMKFGYLLGPHLLDYLASTIDYSCTEFAYFGYKIVIFSYVYLKFETFWLKVRPFYVLKLDYFLLSSLLAGFIFHLGALFKVNLTCLTVDVGWRVNFAYCLKLAFFQETLLPDNRF